MMHDRVSVGISVMCLELLVLGAWWSYRNQAKALELLHWEMLLKMIFAGTLGILGIFAFGLLIAGGSYFISFLF